MFFHLEHAVVLMSLLSSCFSYIPSHYTKHYIEDYCNSPDPFLRVVRGGPNSAGELTGRWSGQLSDTNCSVTLLVEQEVILMLDVDVPFLAGSLCQDNYLEIFFGSKMYKGCGPKRLLHTSNATIRYNYLNMTIPQWNIVFNIIGEPPCQASEMECQNELCVWSQLACDEYDNCEDKTDELTCNYIEDYCNSGDPYLRIVRGGPNSAGDLTGRWPGQRSDMNCSVTLLVGHGDILMLDVDVPFLTSNLSKDNYLEIVFGGKAYKACGPQRLLEASNATIRYNYLNMTIPPWNIIFNTIGNPPCQGAEMACENKLCIWSKLDCDEYDNCEDKSDEYRSTLYGHYCNASEDPQMRVAVYLSITIFLVAILLYAGRMAKLYWDIRKQDREQAQEDSALEAAKEDSTAKTAQILLLLHL